MFDAKLAPSRLALSLIMLSALGGLGVTAFGLSNLDGVDVGSGARSLGVFLALTIALAGLAQLFRRPALCLTIGVGGVFGLLAGVLGSLLTVLAIGMSSFLLGRYMFPTLDGRGALAILVGGGALGTVVGAAAHFPVAYPGVYALLISVPFWLARRDLVEILSRFWNGISGTTAPLSIQLCNAALGALGLMYLAIAMMPEVGHDALAMHLFVPAHLAARHVWSFDPQLYVWAVMPMMGDWLFALAYLLNGELAARLLNVGVLSVLAWLVYEFTRWARGGKLGASLAALVLLSTPLTFTVASSLFIESIWTAFVLGGAMALLRTLWDPEDAHAGLLVGGVLLGYAIATKAVTLPLLPVIGVVMLLGSGRHLISTGFLTRGALALVIMVLLGAIPYLTAWFKTGNPVFPFFNQLFQSSFYPSVNFDSSGIFGKGVRWDTLYQATFNSERFIEGKPGAAGFHWLMLMTPALFALLLTRNSRGLAVLACALLGIVVTFQSVSYLRYVFPSFAFIAVGIGAAASLQIYAVRRFVVGLVVFACLLNIFFLRAGTYYGNFSIEPLLGSVERSRYLETNIPIRNAITLVNALNTTRAPVAVFAPPLVAGLEADALYPSWYNNRFQAQVDGARTEREMELMLSDAGVSYVLLDEKWGSPQKRHLIEAVTIPVYGMTGVSIRQLREEFLYAQELLRHPDFQALDGWSGQPVTKTTGDGVSTTVTAPLTQAVTVIPGKRYRSEVSVRCDPPAQARNQVNWLNAASELIRADIRVMNCQSPNVAHSSMDLIAPEGAVAAMVYASAHGIEPVQFLKVSFRK